MKSSKVGDGIDRRRFLGGSAVLGVGTAVSALWLTGGKSVYAAEHRGCHGHTKYFSYPPYDSAAENDAAYAEYVSAWAAAALGSMPFNIHYGKRENGRIQDVYTGRWYWDCHCCGSMYNLGHRNPVLVAAFKEAVKQIDAGNFLLLSGYRAKLAEKLVATTNGDLSCVTFGTSGTDASEIAMHAARSYTGRRKMVAIANVSVHGATELALSVSGNFPLQHERYLTDTSHTTFVPYNDLGAMEAAITTDTAAVIMEPTPAQAGFPAPAPGYLEGVRAACDAKGALLILDEVQTLGRVGGKVWAYQNYDLVPDVLTTAKGLGGGLYPIAAAIMKKDVSDVYTFGQFVTHDQSYAGTDLGCVIAYHVLELTTDPKFLAHVERMIARFADGLADAPYGVNQFGMCMGLQTEDPMSTSFQLANAGVLAVPSLTAPVVPFRPVLTLRKEEADELIAAVRGALG